MTRDGIARTDILAVGTHLVHRTAIEIQVKTASGTGSKTSWLQGGEEVLDPPQVFLVCGLGADRRLADEERDNEGNRETTSATVVRTISFPG